ncbi:hypothetical protein [Winogradskyella ouciana]|uniref:hypothetical protein n=1 Tax=Winogradskyella ouciana TaxID=2608631 RepID=UPI003D29660F
MISKTLKVGLFVVAIGSMAFCNAQEREGKRKPNPEKIFKKLDSDANGSISLEEFKANRMKDESKVELLEKRFARMDADSSGDLDMVEFKKALARMKGRKDHKPKHDDN